MAIERIVIENFKGIKKLELEVRPFTVLIGPQSVGKSTTAKLLYFFKNIAREAMNAAMSDAGTSLETQLIQRFWKFMPPPTRKGGKSVIRYVTGNAVFSLVSGRNGDSNWRIELPEFFRREFDVLRNELLKTPKPVRCTVLLLREVPTISAPCIRCVIKTKKRSSSIKSRLT